MSTFQKDTVLECTVVPSRGWKRGKLQAYVERASFSAIIVHSTGLGVHRKAKRWSVSPLLAAARIYGQQMDASGHYVVGQNGRIVQCVPEEVVAWHVGGKKRRAYNRARWWDNARMSWWRARWPRFTSPHELALGALWAPNAKKVPSCNSNTIGIEVVPPADNGPWSDECWVSLTALCKDISDRRDLPLSLETVLTHSDAHPVARTTRKGQPWDPAPQQWSYERFAGHAGLPLICRCCGAMREVGSSV